VQKGSRERIVARGEKTVVGEVLGKMILYFETDAKRIQHAMKVYSFALALWEAEAKDKNLPESDPRRRTLLLSAILHDIGIHEAERKHASTAGKYQEIEGPAIAARLLSECGCGAAEIERVCFLIGHHHTYQKMDDLDFQILVEADLLVNLEEDAMDRQAIASVREKHMKTAGSKEILDSYLR
jgi:hypothetical protein